MNNLDWSRYKLELYEICLSTLSDKSVELKLEVEQLRISIANDSKSSMGDKYETSREMMQQQINHLEQQIALNGQQIFNLRSFKPEKNSGSVEKGSLVETTIGNFFISVSYGEIKTSEKSCFLISEFAPLTKLILNLKEGDAFEINKRHGKIISIH